MTIVVVGIGADGWAGLGEPARAEITACDVLFGGPRQLDLVPVDVEKVPWPSPLLPALDELFATHAGKRICVLASGDPLLSGIGTTLLKRFTEGGPSDHREATLGTPDRVRVPRKTQQGGPSDHPEATPETPDRARVSRKTQEVRILPGVSSVALARARLGWSAEETEVISVVGRSVHRVSRALAPGRRILVLGSEPDEVAALLTERGFGDSSMTALEQLAGPAERRVEALAREWSEPTDPLTVLAIRCGSGPALPLLGLPDDVFEHDGQLTKRDMRASALARLAPVPGELLWDVGAGAGSVAIEWSRAHPLNRAIAIERDPERAKRIERNAERLGVPELRVITGTAPGALAGLPTPQAVFVGGGLAALDACWSALAPGGRLVAHAVTLGSEQALARAYTEHDGELIRIGVEHAAPLGGFTGWAPARTVTQWSARKRWETA
ncbi:MAG TPA: precorrin-6Y C5,15-methyltransferase (decarboxylating) subunit CbiT [Amycolatopsis sp.]|uniref:precorrin-6Y C5,15-methyltransferase (decarboxylating) subunit CbiT n=1 Tax=Amycolatopsis sp. TaxID=37632 RepID=UPI002B4A64EB|nr:precorrin-6Y C5,15-methyltransferase (decarboxylating) subunit CbiT [Amycolatopsis sp.]HKS43583.1 precorrin-6Y C5,15-methyltransferase (decarboxylating) subunit CbiT [Amycolatopsis sp.]